MKELDLAIEALRNQIPEKFHPYHDAIMALKKVGVEELPQMKLEREVKRDSHGRVTREITILKFGEVKTQISEDFAKALFQAGVANYL